jgi:hypothetical protein
MKSPPARRVYCTLPLSVLKEVGVHVNAENLSRPRMLATLIEEACAHRTADAIRQRYRKPRRVSRPRSTIPPALDQSLPDRLSHEHKK